MIKRITGYSNEAMIEYINRLERVQLSYMNKEFVSSKKNNAKIEHKRDRSMDDAVLKNILDSKKHYE
jgi:hypothetical protein